MEAERGAERGPPPDHQPENCPVNERGAEVRRFVGGINADCQHEIVTQQVINKIPNSFLERT